jgi:ketosteroid isomerase-like protein
MAEDIRWIGDSSLGDPPPECNGRDEAIALIKRAAIRIPFRDLESIDVSDDRIFAVARWQEGHGPEGRDRVYSLLTMRDGLIVRMQDFFDRAAAEHAYRTPI